MTKSYIGHEQRENSNKKISKIKNIQRRPKQIWSSEEDNKLIKLIEKMGAHRWSEVSELMPSRQGKQCRERWHNHLNPKINKNDWNDQEEWLLFLLHSLIGNKWSIISKIIEGRTDNSIKNHWNSIMQKKIYTYKKKLSESSAIEIENEQNLEEFLIFSLKNNTNLIENYRKSKKMSFSQMLEHPIIKKIFKLKKGKIIKNTNMNSSDDFPKKEKFALNLELTPNVKKNTSCCSLAETGTHNNYNSFKPVKPQIDVIPVRPFTIEDQSYQQMTPFANKSEFRDSLTSLEKEYPSIPEYQTPLKCLINDSNIKNFSIRSPFVARGLNCSITSLKMFWDSQ